MTLFGRGYIADCCLSALKQKEEKKLFEVYVTDALQALVNNTQKFAGGAVIKKRYIEITSESQSKKKKPIKEPAPQESAQEVIDRIKKSFSEI